MSQFQRNRIEEIFDYGLDTEHFTIYLHGVEDNPGEDDEGEVIEQGVEFRLANRFIKGLDVLSGMNSKNPITVSMKIQGGDWREGMAIYDAIMSVPNPVSIISYAQAESMSSIILQAANKRILMPHSIVMIHMGSQATEGTWKQAYTHMNFSARTREEMLDIYVARMKRVGKAKSWAKKRIRQWLIDEMNAKEEVYFTAMDAVKWGLADDVFYDWGSVTEYTEEQKEWKQ